MNEKRGRRIAAGFVLGIALGIAMPILLRLFSWNMYSPQGTIAFAGLVVLVSAFAAILQRRTENRISGEVRPHRLKRPGRGAGIGMLAWQLLLLCFLLIFYFRGGWSARTVGLRFDYSVPLALASGVICYFAFICVLRTALRAAGVHSLVADGTIQTLARLWPRSRAQRILAVVALCVLNPVTEELLFRGILVHQAAMLSGSLYGALAIGLAANIVNHWYQGTWALTTHVPMFFIVCALLFSPLGLLGAIGFHFAGDIYPLTTFPSVLRAYRKGHMRAIGG